MCQKFVHTNLASEIRPRNLESNCQICIYQMIWITIFVYSFIIKEKSIDSSLREFCKKDFETWSCANEIRPSSVSLGWVKQFWFDLLGKPATRGFEYTWSCVNEVRPSPAFFGMDQTVLIWFIWEIHYKGLWVDLIFYEQEIHCKGQILDLVGFDLKSAKRVFKRLDLVKMEDSLQGSETWSCMNRNSIFINFLGWDRKTLT